MKKFTILMSLFALTLMAGSAFAESVTFSAEQIKKIETHITGLKEQIETLTNKVQLGNTLNKTQAETIKKLKEQIAKGPVTSDNAEDIVSNITSGKLTEPGVTNVSKWEVSTDTNPIDDTATESAFLKADSGTGIYGSPIYFGARCLSGEVDVWVTWGSYMGSDDISTTVRHGTSKSYVTNFSMSTDNKAGFSKGPVNFLRQILKADTPVMVLRAMPYSDNPITATFDTTGAKEAFAKIQTTCGAKLF